MRKKYTRQNGYNKLNWHKIGEFSAFENNPFTYTGNIPVWVKDMIPTLLGKLYEDKKRWYKKKFGHTADNLIHRMIVSSNFFNGTQYLKGRHYLYRIIFREGDDTNYGEVFRRPFKSRFGQ